MSTDGEKQTHESKTSAKAFVQQMTISETTEPSSTFSVLETEQSAQKLEPESDSCDKMTVSKSVVQEAEVGTSYPKSSVTEVSETPENLPVPKTSTSAIYVSVIDKDVSSSLETSTETVNSAGATYSSKENTSNALETHALINKTEDNSSECSNENNNDRYFHEIESYFKDEMPTLQAKLHKTADSRRVKRSQSAQEGGKSHTYHVRSGDSSVTSHIPDITSNLTSVEKNCLGRNHESNSKHRLYTKKGSRHKIYDHTVQVAEYNKGDKLSMRSIRSKRKMKERTLSDIPSSRLCTPEADDTNSDSQDSLNDDTIQPDTDRISLKLPLSESLV